MQISLTNSDREAVVDDDDYCRVLKHAFRGGGSTEIRLCDFEWSEQVNGNDRKIYYAVTRCMVEGELRQVFMHRAICEAPSDLVVDHRDSNGLNNRRSNLRQCSLANNQHNSRSRSRTASKYKGITFKSAKRSWEAQIAHRGIQVHIGLSDSEIKAACMYDWAAEELHGEFARPNFTEAERIEALGKIEWHYCIWKALRAVERLRMRIQKELPM